MKLRTLAGLSFVISLVAAPAVAGSLNCSSCSLIGASQPALKQSFAQPVGAAQQFANIASILRNQDLSKGTGFVKFPQPSAAAQQKADFTPTDFTHSDTNTGFDPSFQVPSSYWSSLDNRISLAGQYPAMPSGFPGILFNATGPMMW